MLLDTSPASFVPPLPADLGAYRAEYEALRADLATRATEAERARLAGNPFLKGLRVETRRTSAGDLLESEPVYDAAGQPVEVRHTLVRQLDRAQFVKVLARSYRELFDLGAAGLRLFWLVVERAQRAKGAHEVELYWREVVSFDGDAHSGEGAGDSRIGKTAFYKGLKELEAADFIARNPARPGWYWLNPARLWNGSRVSFVETLDADATAHLSQAERPAVIRPKPKAAARAPRRRRAAPQA